MLFITILSLSCMPQESRLPDPAQVALQRLDRDGSGTVTSDELRDPHAQQLVEWHDANHSGAIDPEELSRVLASDPTGMGDGASPAATSPAGPAPPANGPVRPHVTGQRSKRAPRHRDP